MATKGKRKRTEEEGIKTVDIPTDPVAEISGNRRDRPPMNQAQNPMHDAEIEKERKRIYEELKKRDEKLQANK